MSLLPTDYRTLLGDLSRRAAAVRQPFNGSFEITSRCNLRCGMCYIRPLAEEPQDNSRVPEKELSAAEWVSLAEDAVAHGMVFLLLTGGEPLLRADFFEIYEPIRALGLNLILFTNGTLVNREIAGRLAQAPPNRLEITLYGASAATYEAVTGVPGSHGRCLTGIENLRTAGVPFSVKTTLNRHNIDELGAMERMAREWGLTLTKSWLITPRRDRRESALGQYRLAPCEVVALETAGRERRELTPRANPEPHAAPKGVAALPCSAGVNSFVVTATGEMNICMDLPRPAAKPLECGFAAAWERVNRAAESVGVSATCGACELEPLCPRCPAFAWLEEGDTDATVPYLCEIARERGRSLPIGN
jgi:radical SAM protein with 4Fe4S-binding SPASM domain